MGSESIAPWREHPSCGVFFDCCSFGKCCETRKLNVVIDGRVLWIGFYSGSAGSCSVGVAS